MTPDRKSNEERHIDFQLALDAFAIAERALEKALFVSDVLIDDANKARNRCLSYFVAEGEEM